MFCRAVAVLVLVSLGFVAPAGASQVIPRTLPELVAGAELIFVGRCEAVSTGWNEDRTLIYTAHRFRVARALKGQPGEIVTIEELGGTVGAIGLEVSGSPRYAVGEVALLFAHRTPSGRWQTLGAGQGKFRIVRDARGRPRVRSDFYESELAAMTPPDRPGEGAPLDLFAARLQAAPRTERRR